MITKKETKKPPPRNFERSSKKVFGQSEKIPEMHSWCREEKEAHLWVIRGRRNKIQTFPFRNRIAKKLGVKCVTDRHSDPFKRKFEFFSGQKKENWTFGLRVCARVWCCLVSESRRVTIACARGENGFGRWQSRTIQGGKDWKTKVSRWNVRKRKLWRAHRQRKALLRPLSISFPPFICIANAGTGWRLHLIQSNKCGYFTPVVIDHHSVDRVGGSVDYSSRTTAVSSSEMARPDCRLRKSSHLQVGLPPIALTSCVLGVWIVQILIIRSIRVKPVRCSCQGVRFVFRLLNEKTDAEPRRVGQEWKCACGG